MGTAAMELGDTVMYQGRALVLRGLDPMSVANACAQLEDTETGELYLVPLAELEQAPRPVSGSGT
ncbi:MAG: hypothetical protein JOZ56_06895 [Actinobacteria bacterium]|nr:hypothetical protein [Actinomycetota bacterium]